ncbi:hypothetical protein L1887_00752 [Cichorium endivia]|nr:hypothetical protein L1887_00752 [Cichorium endivia]
MAMSCGCKSTSHCLKLYCPCFGADRYCSEPCSCNECQNLPEYHDRVIKAREEAKVQNPYVFSTKEGRPTGAKKKTGCKCKVRLMCSNERCKCYKAKVGCDTGECICSECQNVNGKRGDNVDMTTGTSTSNQTELMNQFAPQDMIVRHPSTVTNLPYISSLAGSSNLDMFQVDPLESVNQLKPQYINNAGHVCSVMNVPCIPSPAEALNRDMMIGTSTRDPRLVPLDQPQFRNQFRPQNMNIPFESSNPDMMIGTSTRDSRVVHDDRHPSSVTNLPYIPSPAESSTENVMIGTSTRDSDMDLAAQVAFMNWLIPHDLNVSNDDMKNEKK